MNTLMSIFFSYDLIFGVCILYSRADKTFKIGTRLPSRNFSTFVCLVCFYLDKRSLQPVGGVASVIVS